MGTRWDAERVLSLLVAPSASLVFLLALPSRASTLRRSAVKVRRGSLVRWKTVSGLACRLFVTRCRMSERAASFFTLS